MIPFEILTSPQFDSILTLTSECISTIFDTAVKNYTPQSQRPLSQPQLIQTSTTPLLSDLIVKLLSSPIQLPQAPRPIPTSTPVISTPASLIPIEQIRKTPFILQDRQTASRAQLEAWASTVVLASLRGRHAFVKSLILVWDDDSLPLTEKHLKRCNRMVRLERKWGNIPTIDAQNGKVKQKNVSVMGKQQSVQKGISKEKEVQMLSDYRGILKNVLRDFNLQFEKKFGREPNKEDKEQLRPLYMEYKALKQYVADEIDSKQLSVDDPIVRPLLMQLIQIKQQATNQLQKVVPRDQSGIKLFKREVQKCLFSYKELYDKSLSAVQFYKKANGKIPHGLQENWAQGFIEVYNLLFSAYEKLKAQVK
ncbi:hypothetical protein SS50377_27186 [Spironucleus salmonicida]|uniref:FAM13A-like domain-containing protein n=1 Tax=Spironucleus salmonicida TaxID=348837 RepID=V6M0L6_9EUKA|nr:hypothetical protein SS50377_27186 [Spironucleus salmonicida]|eukprot:EST49596.1 hypothetical protein SS50377_10039 [Spironucleus salmonicida]